MQAEEIKQLIENAIDGCTVNIEGDDGVHFGAIIVSEAFSGKTMVQQHQMVYQALGDKMGGDIHALSMQTYTPEEWEKKKHLRVV